MCGLRSSTMVRCLAHSEQIGGGTSLFGLVQIWGTLEFVFPCRRFYRRSGVMNLVIFYKGVGMNSMEMLSSE